MSASAHGSGAAADGAASDRDLADAIYQEITNRAAIHGALDTWRATSATDMHYRMWVAISTNAAAAIDTVLTRRLREAARTGPWEGEP